MDWREHPANIVRQVVGVLEQDRLEYLINAYGYALEYVEPSIVPYAYTDHLNAEVVCPKTQNRQRMLLHELAEILLQQPIAPEYYYPPTAEDEIHNVASLVESFFYPSKCQ